MSETLPKLYTAEQVAEAIGETEGYVKRKCQRHEWPHRRGARGVHKFTADDFAQIVELIASPVSDDAPTPRFQLAPRSKRAS
jgi:hypothetical protein